MARTRQISHGPSIRVRTLRGRRARQEAQNNALTSSSNQKPLVLNRVLLPLVLPFLDACEVALLWQIGEHQLQRALTSTTTSLSWCHPCFDHHRTRASRDTCSLPFNFIPTISTFLNLHTLVVKPLSKGSAQTVWVPLIRLLPPSLVNLELYIHEPVLNFFLEKLLDEADDDDDKDKDKESEKARIDAEMLSKASFTVFGRFPLLQSLILGSHQYSDSLDANHAITVLNSLPRTLKSLKLDADADRAVLEALPPNLTKLSWTHLLDDLFEYLPKSLTSFENGSMDGMYSRAPITSHCIFDILPNLVSYAGRPILINNLANIGNRPLERVSVRQTPSEAEAEVIDSDDFALLPRSLLDLTMNELLVNDIHLLPRDLLALKVSSILGGRISGANGNDDENSYDDADEEDSDDEGKEKKVLSVEEMMQTVDWKNSLDLTSSWPQNLRKLTLRMPPGNHIFIYSLPRTLTDLNLDWLALDARHVQLLPQHLRLLKCCCNLKDAEYGLLPRSLEVLESFRASSSSPSSELFKYLPRGLRVLTLDYDCGFHASFAPHLPQSLAQLNLWSINLLSTEEMEARIPDKKAAKPALAAKPKTPDEKITELTPAQVESIEDCDRRITDFVEQLPNNLLLTAWFKYESKFVRTSAYLEQLLPSFYTSDACTHRTKQPIRMRLSMF